MPAVHAIGPVFFHRMAYPTTSFPVVERGSTQETDHPFRSGKSVVVRLPGTRQALVIGRWVTAGSDEESALYEAIGARDVGEYHP